MVSLVTACMNREAHLRQSLPAWLKLPAVDEIVLVDWSTREPFDDLLALDSRIRIVRAVDEPRWILSYAYNLGIEQAAGDIIFKCDADCMPSPEVLKLVPLPGRFYAGDWRSGDSHGKTCVNGQCLFTREQWRQVNGYSELLRRYGHDDGDFYDRLATAGHVRTEIPPPLFDFVRHTDEDRIANSARPQTDRSLESFLEHQLSYHETMNRLIAGMIPWGPWFPRAKFDLVTGSERLRAFRRDVSSEIPISMPMLQLARAQAIRGLALRFCKIPPALFNRMDETACLAQLARYVQTTQAANAAANRSAA